MKPISVVLELLEDGEVMIKSSHDDLAMIVLIMERSKLQLLQNLKFKEPSNIVVPVPRNGGL